MSCRYECAVYKTRILFYKLHENYISTGNLYSDCEATEKITIRENCTAKERHVNTATQHFEAVIVVFQV